MEGDDDMSVVEAGTPPSSDVPAEEPAADDEVALPDGEEPTEEQVANAMRLSGTGSAEASPVKEDESTGSEESKTGQTSCALSSDIQDDFKCPTCGSTDDPSFMHCKKILKQTGTNFGAFVWRYRCARQDCAKFFGEYYAYDKVSNSFVRLPEDADMVEQGKTEEEQRPEIPEVEDEDDSDSAHSPPVAENIEPAAAEDTKAEDEPSAKEEPIEKTPHRSSRRARQTIRKSTAVVAKVKTPLSAEKKNQTPLSLEKKKPEKTPISKTPKEAKSRVTPKRQPKKAVEVEKVNSAPPIKKLPKGYVYEPVLDPQQQQKVAEMIQKASVANGCVVSSSSSECGTQTMCPGHVFSTLIDQLVNTQAESSVGSSLTMESPATLPRHVARRLMVSQQLIQRQSDELNRVQEENKRLHNIVGLMNSVIRKFGDEYTPELRHLRDAIVVLKREFSFYQDEFVAEAKKSVVNIQAQKEEVQRKIDEVERKNRLLSARIDLHIKEREAADERADGFLRKISERDRDVILANKARDRAERKLKDSLYVANNAKCAHCQISDRMRAHLTDVVAEKTVLLEKSQKECQELSRRADQSERISRILSKESEKLKFDLNTWKSDAERNLAEIARLKEELKRASAGHPMLNATTAMLQKPKAEAQSPRQAASHSNSPAVRESSEKPSTPRDSDLKGATPAQDERSNSAEPEVKSTSTGNRTAHANPGPRTPPEDPDSPFSSWLGKERRVDVSPPRFFGSASSSRQAPSSASTRRAFPFNGPVFTDRPMSKDAAKNGEKLSQKSPRLTSDVARSVDTAGSSERVPPPHGRRHEGHAKEVSSKPARGSSSARTSASFGYRTTSYGSRRRGTAGGYVDVTSPYPGVSGERAMSWSPSVSDDFNANTKTAIPSLFDAAAPRKWNGPAVVVDKQSLSGSRGESRKRKNWETDVVDKNPAARILPAVPPRPFNGPIALSTGAVPSTSRPVREASPILEKERSEFSSSPLPWHQEGPPLDYTEWESSVTEYSPPSHTFEKRTDLASGRPMAQRQRKNFWEP